MSKHVPYNMISKSNLLDVVDEQWAMDKLPDDGEHGVPPMIPMMVVVVHIKSPCCQRARQENAGHRAEVPLPEELQVKAEDQDDAQGKPQVDKWTDMGLGSFR